MPADTLQTRVRRKYGVEDRENEFSPDSGLPPPEDTFATAVDRARTDPSTFAAEPPPQPFARSSTPEPAPVEPSPTGSYSDQVVASMSPEQREDVKAAVESAAERVDSDEDPSADADAAISELRVNPKVYADFKTAMSQALTDYRAEVDHANKAKLWGAIIRGLATLAIAQTTQGWAGGPESLKFSSPDYESDLTQAARNFDAVRSTLKEGLATEKDKAEEARSELRLTEYQEARKDRKAAKIESDKAKKKKETTTAAVKTGNELGKRRDTFVKEFTKTLDDKKLTPDEKQARIEQFLVKSGLPISPETRAKMLKKFSYFDNVTQFKTDKEMRTEALTEYLEKELAPFIEQTKNPPVTVTKDGVSKQVPRANAEELVRDFGWELEE